MINMIAYFNRRYVGGYLSYKYKSVIHPIWVEAFEYDGNDNIVCVGTDSLLKAERIRLPVEKLICQGIEEGYYNIQKTKMKGALYAVRNSLKSYVHCIRPEHYSVFATSGAEFRRIHGYNYSLELSGRALYSVLNPVYIPFGIALDLLLSGKLLSVALSKRIAIASYIDYKYPSLCYRNKRIGFIVDGDPHIHKEAMEAQRDIEETIYRHVVPMQ